MLLFLLTLNERMMRGAECAEWPLDIVVRSDKPGNAFGSAQHLQWLMLLTCAGSNHAWSVVAHSAVEALDKLCTYKRKL